MMMKPGGLLLKQMLFSKFDQGWQHAVPAVCSCSIFLEEPCAGGGGWCGGQLL
jgi:hypothetical protein